MGGLRVGQSSPNLKMINSFKFIICLSLSIQICHDSFIYSFYPGPHNHHLFVQHLSVSISKEPGVHEEFGFGAEPGLSAEVAALVHAAKAKEWTPEAAGIDGIDGKVEKVHLLDVSWFLREMGKGEYDKVCLRKGEGNKHLRCKTDCISLPGTCSLFLCCFLLLRWFWEWEW